MSDPRDTSTFRNPPWMSLGTPVSVAAWAARTLGFGVPFVRTLATKMLAPDQYRAIFANYEPLPEDVFVAVFSKSGTNWAMQMAAQIAWRGQAEFAHVHEYVAWPGSPFTGVVPLTDPGWRAAPEPRHIIKCSAPLEVLPVDSPARFLCVLRDPKEVVVSAYHFIMDSFGLREAVSAASWIDFAIEGLLLDAWVSHAAQVWDARDRDNVHVLRFESLKQDLGGELDEVSAFLGVQLTRGERAAVLERCGFAWMKDHEYRFGPPILRFLGGRPAGKMLRKGASGGSGELLSRQEQDRIDALALEKLDALGSDLPYRDWYVSPPT
ncbi:MAG: sulfotransferase domain-containing protein [Deltaproteobacteria bacterium]|nr:sulfotransferase domain-containing protein [Deltaproteobacteria bacterium]